MKSKTITFDEYKRLFIRFCKNEGTWTDWQKHLKYQNKLDNIINLCLLTTYDVNYGYIYDTFQINDNITLSTPFDVSALFKGFSNKDIYNNFSLNSKISKILFKEYLTKFINKKIND